MRQRLYIFLPLILFTSASLAQRPTMELTFTAVDSATWVQLDSIRVMNRTQGGDTVLYYPDTVLVLDYTVGITDVRIDDRGFEVYQNSPNPVSEKTTVSIRVPESGQVSIMVTDIPGRVLLNTGRVLDRGVHSFRLTPGNSNIVFFSAQWKGNVNSIKILSPNHANSPAATLEYIGGTQDQSEPKMQKDIQGGFDFSPGDELLYIGYTDTLESGILNAPEESQTYTFQFAYGIPCPGSPTVDYEGQVYNTVQIFGQCWLRENLNVGVMIDSLQGMWDNGIMEKYCYRNKEDSCTKYGGLYQWDETMQYNHGSYNQGICPEGWHIPNDDEWRILEGSVDSQYGIDDPVWDLYDYRGYNAGENLKSSAGWFFGSNGTDLYGFSGLPAGRRKYNWGKNFEMIGEKVFWWSSSVAKRPLTRLLHDYFPGISRYDGSAANGFSVRCLRDETYTSPIELTFTAIDSAAWMQLDSIRVMNRSLGAEAMLYGSDTTLLLPIELQLEPGDELLYIGYADTLESGITDCPSESLTYTFQFAYDIPCPGSPTVDYEGQVYNTVQIFSQCWLKENLNVGTMIPGLEDMTDNGIMEKYCYDNEPDSCVSNGGLYQWNEMMQYTTQQGAQGICPTGWHIPTDDEWKVLEGAVDSQYGIGNNTWNNWDYRGYDAGTNLKTTNGWFENGNGTNLFGFSGMAGGERLLSGAFWDFGLSCSWWSSSELIYFDDAWYRTISNDHTQVFRYSHKLFGLSVRCIRDEPYSSPSRK